MLIASWADDEVAEALSWLSEVTFFFVSFSAAVGPRAGGSRVAADYGVET
ncbi:MAG: hypothetical protein Q4G67_02130 [Actinomycetia bacterium]|nr:hypothetical protein [Actinomycetes bacterium]